MRVGRRDDVRPGGSRAYRVGRYEIAVFDVAGRLYALENVCPHQGAPLTDGWMDGPIVTCSWHAWCFDVRTGRMTLGEFASIAKFDVRESEGVIYVSSEPVAE